MILEEKMHTPVIAQYLSIKSENPDYLLFFRMGDFYELFFEDAKKGLVSPRYSFNKQG